MSASVSNVFSSFPSHPIYLFHPSALFMARFFLSFVSFSFSLLFLFLFFDATFFSFSVSFLFLCLSFSLFIGSSKLLRDTALAR